MLYFSYKKYNIISGDPMMAEARISAKGWVVIPAAFRHKYHLKQGDQVRIVDYGGGLAIIPELADPVKEARGMLKGNTSLIDSLQAERAEERRREDTRS
jgi:AbrB family looped-hinge helix DNA binding protein